MQDYTDYSTEENKKSFLKFFIFSAIVHVALFFIFIQSPFQAAEKVKLPPSITVSIKTLEKPPAKKNSIIKKKVVKVKTKKKKVKRKKKIKRSVKKKRKAEKKRASVNLKKSRKKKRKKRSEKKRKKESVKELSSKKVKETNKGRNKKESEEKIRREETKRKLDDIYKRLRSRVKKQSAIKETEISNKAKALGKIRAERIRQYQNHIALIIEKNWSYNKQISKETEHLETLIVFKVMPDGSIKDIAFEKESEDDYLNDSAYKAIIKSNPLSPHPKDISEKYILIPLKFTPSGVN